MWEEGSLAMTPQVLLTVSGAFSSFYCLLVLVSRRPPMSVVVGGLYWLPDPLCSPIRDFSFRYYISF